MSVKVSLRQAQNDLPGLLDQVAKTGEELVIQRDGKDCAVIVNASEWRRRKVARVLDGLGSALRLSGTQQKRAELLLATKKQRSLTAVERRELKELLRESDAVMLQRAAALDTLL